jgi:hypothetical protein
MRLIIIVEDDFVSVDGYGLFGVNLDWVPKIKGEESGITTTVHAVQWYEDHGHIELSTSDPNIPIKKLGVFNKAVDEFNKRKSELEEEERKNEEIYLEEDSDMLSYMSDIYSEDLDEYLQKINSYYKLTETDESTTN